MTKRFVYLWALSIVTHYRVTSKLTNTNPNPAVQTFGVLGRLPNPKSFRPELSSNLSIHFDDDI